MNSVTLYVPCYNAAGYIARCLEAALGQSRKADELLVIDDGSTDDTVELASRYPVTVIRHGANKGLAAARNTAVLAAKGELVASLDSDCLPRADWLERLSANFMDPGVAAAGGRLLESNPGRIIDRWRSIYMRQNWGAARIVNPRFLFGSNTIFRREALKEAGLYDIKYRTNYEDCDMSLRLRAKGLTLVYDPSAVAYHIREDSFRSVMETHWRWTFSGVTSTRVPDSLYSIGCKFYDGVFYFFKDMAWSDLKNGRPELLPMDIASCFHHFYKDIRYYIGSKQKKGR